MISSSSHSGRAPASARACAHLVDEAGGAELPGRDVDADVAQRGSSGSAARQRGELAPAPRRSTQPPIADDRAVLLGQLDEVVRAEQAARRVLPAHQRLDADDVPVAQVDDRLVLQRGTARASIASCSASPHLQPLHHRGVQFAAVPLPGALAVALGLVERQVGVAQQLGGAGRVAAGGHADAGRAADDVRAAEAVADLDRRGQRGDDPGRQFLGRRRRRCSTRTANSSPPIRAAVSAAPTIVGDPLADGDQQLVADRVPEGVVDLLEVVQVDEEHAERGAVALGQPGRRAPGGCGTAPGWPGR